MEDVEGVRIYFLKFVTVSILFSKAILTFEAPVLGGSSTIPITLYSMYMTKRSLGTEQEGHMERVWTGRGCMGLGVGEIKKKNGAGFGAVTLGRASPPMWMCEDGGVVRTLALIKCHYGTSYMSASVKNDVLRIAVVCLSFSTTRHPTIPRALIRRDDYLFIFLRAYGALATAPAAAPSDDRDDVAVAT